MADTTTTALGLTKPQIGASENTWGEKINTNMDLIDAVLDDYPTTGSLSNRSLIINGAMNVAQRGTSATGVNSDNFTCDRFKSVIAAGTIGAYTISQDADAPSGFANSLKLETTIANASPIAAAYNVLFYTFEGQDVQRLGKGTADAQQATLSFWVKSNKTGTYQVNLADTGNARIVGSTYSVAVSGTWEKKTITFPADTVGAVADDNLGTMNIEWWLDSGTDWSSGATPTAWETTADTDRNAGSNVNLADTVGNYIQITGVQMEVGDTATPFENRSYAQELTACQRYYEVDNPSTPTSFAGSIAAQAYHPTNGTGNPLNRDGPFQPYKVDKRASATVTTYAYNGTSGAASPITNAGTDTNVQVRATTTGFQLSSSTYRALHVWFAWAADAEL